MIVIINPLYTMLKKAFLGFLALIAVLVVGVFLYIQVQSEDMPALTSGPEADQLANKMLKAINYEAWDSTAYVSWSFTRRGHRHVWDKKRHFVEVTWDKFRVLVSPNDGRSVVYVNDQLASTQEEKDKLTKIAIAHFNNDSFWLNAPAKVFDAGTTRSIATLEDGSKALAVKYNSGGTTPGDSYLWMLDENNRPKAWKMWVSIVPISGMHITWENWKQTRTGAWIAQNHQSSIVNIPIDEVKTGMSLAEIAKEPDLFAPLMNTSFNEN